MIPLGFKLLPIDVQVTIIAIGHKMPAWIQAGFQDYAQRMPADFRLHLVALPAPTRSKSTHCQQLMLDEGKRILKALPQRRHLIALDQRGRAHTTESLAQSLQTIMGTGKDLAIAIGGADGLHPCVTDTADELWSLSQLTFPHPLVRVIIAEQLYRAYSYLHNHPYHRA